MSNELAREEICLGCNLPVSLHGIADDACWGCELAKLRTHLPSPRAGLNEAIRIVSALPCYVNMRDDIGASVFQQAAVRALESARDSLPAEESQARESYLSHLNDCDKCRNVTDCAEGRRLLAAYRHAHDPRNFPAPPAAVEKG